MRTPLLRLKALLLTILLLGGSLGVPAVDLVVWHLGGSHHPASVTPGHAPRDAGQHEQQCVFTHVMPSPTPVSPGVAALALGEIVGSRITTAGPALDSSPIHRTHPSRAPPVLLA